MLSRFASLFARGSKSENTPGEPGPQVGAPSVSATSAGPGLSTEVHRLHLEQNLPTLAEQSRLIQRWKSVMPSEDVKARLQELRPEVPWCHYYELGDGLYTVTPAQAKHFAKARDLKIIADCLRDSLPYICRKQDLRDLDVLDLACAEGAHSIELAHAGVHKVVGVEGRQIYVDRASFVAKVAGLANAAFQQGDVRNISRAALGGFDLVLFFGILHHLSDEDCFPMLQKLYEVTDDTLLLFTHTSESGWETKFKLGEEIINKDGLRGRLYREHPEGASDEVKAARIRNSLDNTFSFWAREASLLDAVKRAGFRYVARQLAPNPFADPAGEFRVFYVCRR